MSNGNTTWVAYLRVSTDKQGRDGLGIEAQRQVIQTHIDQNGGGTLVESFVEVESGAKRDRKQLQRAVEVAKKTHSTLLVAKIDRLTRDSVTLQVVRDSGVSITCCDNPAATDFVLNILACVAENERQMISKRTKDALQALKAKGVILGRPRNTEEEVAKMEEDLARGRAKQRNAADQWALDRIEVFRPIIESSATLVEVAKKLNGVVSTRRGGKWSATHVMRLIKRLNACGESVHLSAA